MTTRTVLSSDLYGLERTLEPSERAVLHAVRTFMRDEVEPIINAYWTRAKFPFQILDGFRQLDIAGLPYEGYGCPGHSRTLDGMVFMEIARTDPSIATFHGVHSGSAMGTIYECGADEQRDRWLPGMAATASSSTTTSAASSPTRKRSTPTRAPAR